MRALHLLDQPMQRVLIIDHNLGFGQDLRLSLDQQANLEVIAWLPDCNSGLTYASELRPDVLVFGWSWEVTQTIRAIRTIEDSSYRPTIIVFADDGDLNAFVTAKRCGAHSVHYRCNMHRVLASSMRHLGVTEGDRHRPIRRDFAARRAAYRPRAVETLFTAVPVQA